MGDASGMGQVFKTTRGEETCAIKVIHEAVERVRDVLANEIPDSKYVIPILESESRNGQTFLRMPLADHSLGSFRKTRPHGKLTIEEVISALRDIATSLADIGPHVTHRDIKPDNVLWYGGRWCLTDFGLARIAEATTATFTMKGWGTKEYIAPELLTGDRASGKSDIYALGVAAYLLLMGKYPFEKHGPISTEDIFQWHLNGEIPRPDSGSSQLD
ncbi:protein kinase domain-containing protein [Rhodococcus tibetensis]|uniref:mitogen-activated protein kinase kinase n=1 Tax=Rhodococcus tibetensis TaxID=2965064 RepID=A0ABT1Q7B7_9NOCA|nr:protein kinase [Rhodococcus sp. FXJ9.536]MCQ4118144.1 protein kinase [Rhodococcus sp. FXJ9.536]